jgi:NADH-quinone oxidoreductase subunit C
MTEALSGEDIAGQIGGHLADAVAEFDESAVFVKGEALLEVARLLKDGPGFGFDYLTAITAVDYKDFFEVIYHLTSMTDNRSIVLKTRLHTRENPILPSVVGVWKGADFQEREIYDLMGIAFDGHHNLKRIFLWEGFQGHPLRKDFGSDA